MEVKQYLSRSDYWILKQILAVPSLKNGRPAEYKETRVHNLYFENTDMVVNISKNAMYNTEHFSIRYYDENTSVIKLEKKTKKKDSVIRRTAYLTRNECEQLINGDLFCLKGKEDPLLYEFYKKMETGNAYPKLLMDYTRESFLYNPGKVQITLDSDYTSGQNVSDFFNEKHPTIKKPDQYVLKVKYDRTLPEIITRLLDEEPWERNVKYAYAD